MSFSKVETERKQQLMQDLSTKKDKVELEGPSGEEEIDKLSRPIVNMQTRKGILIISIVAVTFYRNNAPIFLIHIFSII